MQFKYGKAYLRDHVRHQKWWSGNIGPENADNIAELVAATSATRIADYGSGKGYQYLTDRVHERWGGILPHCYDVGVWNLKRPLMPGSFDGLICTDVMEHIATADIKEILADAIALLRDDGPVFAYFNIFCNLAAKSFPDGRNVHLTVQPPDWWEAKHFKKLRRRENLRLWVDYEYVRSDDLQCGSEKRL